MRLGDHPQACADCGDMFTMTAHVRLHLEFTGARPLCAVCLHLDRQPAKKAAEIWLLEQMYAQRDAAPFDKLRMAIATLRPRGTA